MQSHPQSSAPQPPSTLLCQGTSRTPLPRTDTTTSLCIIHHQLHTTRVSLLLSISPLPLPQVLLLFFACFLEYKKSISHKSTLASDLGAKLSSLSIFPWVRGSPQGAATVGMWCCHPYLVGVVAVQPALDVGGVPARHQAAVLQGPELRSSLRSRRDHLMEGVFQGDRVIMSSLVLSGMSKAGLFLGQPKSWAAHEVLPLPGHHAVSLCVLFSQKAWHPQPPHLPNQGDGGKPLAQHLMGLPKPEERQGRASHLIPGVGSICRVDEDGDDFGLGEQGRGSPGSHF